MAIVLQKMGWQVALIEKKDHPRFTIGESSTPAADMILRDLAAAYHLPWLSPMSRYGSWKKTYPTMTCGIKRGFSYYFHELERPFRSDQNRSRELLVAASESNEQSDTQWYRPETDLFFFLKAKEAGVKVLSRCDIVDVEKVTNKARGDEDSGTHAFFWHLTAHQGVEREKLTLQADWLIDATGSAAFGDTHLGTTSDLRGLKTNSSALYTHVEQLPRWRDEMDNCDVDTSDYPFDPDFSALHHLTDDGWLWMLRFDHDRVSVGWMTDHCDRPASVHEASPGLTSTRKFQRYPSLARLFRHAELSPVPGQWIQTERVQRYSMPAVGPGWVRLPHSAGFIDPMHSTGIAHTLSGVERIAACFEVGCQKEEREKKLDSYQQSVVLELKLIDLLVSGAYRTRNQPDLFEAWLSWYFVFTMEYEQKRLSGNRPDSFLMADHRGLRQLAEQSYDELLQVLAVSDRGDERRLDWIARVRDQIAPFNRAGLLDPVHKRLYRHSMVDLG